MVNNVRLCDLARMLDVKTQDVLDVVDLLDLDIKDNPLASASRNEADAITDALIKQNKEKHMAKAKDKDKKPEKKVPEGPKFGRRVYDKESGGWKFPNKKSLK